MSQIKIFRPPKKQRDNPFIKNTESMKGYIGSKVAAVPLAIILATVTMLPGKRGIG